MIAPLKRLLRPVTAPLLDWLAAQLQGVRELILSVQDRVDELARLNRDALVERDAGLDVVSRAVGVQAATLEELLEFQRRTAGEQQRLAEQQQRLSEEVAALRDLLTATAVAADGPTSDR